MGGPADFRITGDTIKFDKFLLSRRFRKNLEREVRKATILNSLLVIKAMGRKIRDRSFKDNTDLTLALTRGQIPLLKDKNMLDAMSYQLQNAFVSEVGWLEGRESTGGVTGQTIQMQKLVELVNEGYMITVTPKMIAAIMAALRNRKTKSGRLTKKAKTALDAFEGTEGGGGRGQWKVAARPFVEQVMTDPELIKTIRKNWSEAIERAYLAQGALGGEHKDR